MLFERTAISGKPEEFIKKDIVIRMAAIAWPIVLEYEIDLGTGDMIP